MAREKSAMIHSKARKKAYPQHPPSMPFSPSISPSPLSVSIFFQILSSNFLSAACGACACVFLSVQSQTLVRAERRMLLGRGRKAWRVVSVPQFVPRKYALLAQHRVGRWWAQTSWVRVLCFNSPSISSAVIMIVSITLFYLYGLIIVHVLNLSFCLTLLELCNMMGECLKCVLLFPLHRARCSPSSVCIQSKETVWMGKYTLGLL